MHSNRLLDFLTFQTSTKSGPLGPLIYCRITLQNTRNNPKSFKRIFTYLNISEIQNMIFRKPGARTNDIVWMGPGQSPISVVLNTNGKYDGGMLVNV